MNSQGLNPYLNNKNIGIPGKRIYNSDEEIQKITFPNISTIVKKIGDSDKIISYIEDESTLIDNKKEINIMAIQLDPNVYVPTFTESERSENVVDSANNILPRTREEVSKKLHLISGGKSSSKKMVNGEALYSIGDLKIIAKSIGITDLKDMKKGEIANAIIDEVNKYKGVR